MRALAEVKGINFRGMLDAVEGLYGAQAQREAIAACSTELSHQIRHGGITPAGWYPIASYREMLHAIVRVLPGESQVPHQCARWAIQRDLSGIYRVLLFLLTPESIINKAPRVVRQYWRGGKMEVFEARPGMGWARFDGWLGFDQNVWEDVLGGVEGALEAAGARNVRFQVLAGGGDGDDVCEFAARWTGR